jgi:D-sedoheptulose 7-phosphate isomerase
LAQVEDTATVIKVMYSRQLEAAIDMLFEAWKDGRWVYVMGNGGSASTATHLVADLAKTICEKPQDRGIRAMALVDNIPLVSALTNDWGWENIYVNQLATFYVEGGVGIGISVHGGSGKDVAGAWSQNLLKGLQYIKDRGGKTIGLSGFDGGPMKTLVDVGIVVPAQSTPIVEGMHVVLHHLIVFGLKEKIHAYQHSAQATSGIS